MASRTCILQSLRIASMKKSIGLGGGLRRNYPTPSSSNVSAVMKGNRKKDTAPELAIRQRLHAMGLRYRVHSPIDLSGQRVRPDVVFSSSRVAVFIDGCFWHGCPHHGTSPKANSTYWDAKLARNKERDRSNRARLRRAGWTVVRIWEHTDPLEAANRIAAIVRSTRET